MLGSRPIELGPRHPFEISSLLRGGLRAYKITLLSDLARRRALKAISQSHLIDMIVDHSLFDGTTYQSRGKHALD